MLHQFVGQWAAKLGGICQQSLHLGLACRAPCGHMRCPLRPLKHTMIHYVSFLWKRRGVTSGDLITVCTTRAGGGLLATSACLDPAYPGLSCTNNANPQEDIPGHPHVVPHPAPCQALLPPGSAPPLQHRLGRKPRFFEGNAIGT